MIKLALSILPVVGIALVSKDTIRVTTYNLLNFSGDEGRNGHFETVIEAINPDIILVQEMVSELGVDSFRLSILDDEYNTIPFHNGWDTDNHVFFKTDKLTCLLDTFLILGQNHRDIGKYKMLINATEDTVYFYSAHLKASQGSENEQQRFQEATILREHLNEFPSTTNFIVVGDLNLYRSDEMAYQKLIGDEADNDGRLFDPIDSPGYWHTNAAFAGIHTQSTRSEQFGGGASGGLDDRFDFILISQSLQDNVLATSYVAFGNDGNHFDQSVNEGTNDSVSVEVANALYYASDHLPILCDFVFEKVNATSEQDKSRSNHTALFSTILTAPTLITYQLGSSTDIELAVFDALGRKVVILDKGFRTSGEYELILTPAELPAGVYYCVLRLNGASLSKKMILKP